MAAIHVVTQVEVRKITVVQGATELDFVELRFASSAAPNDPILKSAWLRLSTPSLVSLRSAIDSALATPTQAMPPGWLDA